MKKSIPTILSLIIHLFFINSFGAACTTVAPPEKIFPEQISSEYNPADRNCLTVDRIEPPEKKATPVFSKHTVAGR